MADILSLALPFFGLIFLGFGSGWLVKLPEGGLSWLNFFIIYIALPALFFELVSRTPIDQIANWSFVLTTTRSKELALDSRDPDATREAIKKIIAAETSDYWRPKLADADCCVTIVATLEEALADRHFVERGLFERKVAMPDGKAITAMPLPIEPSLRVED